MSGLKRWHLSVMTLLRTLKPRSFDELDAGVARMLNAALESLKHSDSRDAENSEMLS